MKVFHVESKREISSHMKYAKTFFERTKGLMFVSHMKGFDSLLIEKCNSVHNCFVKFPLDLIFLNDELEVIKVIHNFKPWRFTRMYLKATKVLELNVGGANGIKKGDHLEVKSV